MRSPIRLNAFRRAAIFSLGVAISFTILTFTREANGQLELPAGTRIIRAVSTTAAPGGHANVSIEIESLGNEIATGFTLNFDQSKLSNPIVSLGSGAAGFTLTVNTIQAPSGRVGVIVDAGFAFAPSPPARQIVSISFDVAPDAPEGATPLMFAGTPISQSTSDYEGNSLSVTYQSGAVTISAVQAPNVSIAGTVSNPNGQGISNATVVLVNAAGDRQTARTNSFGSYTFNSVPAGVLYRLDAYARRYQFQSVFVQPNNNLTGVDFEGIN